MQSCYQHLCSQFTPEAASSSLVPSTRCVLVQYLHPGDNYKVDRKVYIVLWDIEPVAYQTYLSHKWHHMMLTERVNVNIPYNNHFAVIFIKYSTIKYLCKARIISLDTFFDSFNPTKFGRGDIQQSQLHTANYDSD